MGDRELQPIPLGRRRDSICSAPEALPLLRELGIGFVAYSPFGRGFLTWTITSTGQFTPGDFRTDNPRFTDENFQHNLRSAEEGKAIAAEAGVTPAQVALAWLLTRGDDIAPIPAPIPPRADQHGSSPPPMHPTRSWPTPHTSPAATPTGGRP